jgi:ribonucleotide monophosphatase NagD (HAD superfamily)
MNPSLVYLKPIVAFDVDNTLVDDDEEPREEVVQLFRLLQRFGCRMVVWSNGGGENESSLDYADRICEKLGLEAQVIEKGSIQPDITIDDLDMHTRISEGTLGRVNIKV